LFTTPAMVSSLGMRGERSERGMAAGRSVVAAAGQPWWRRWEALAALLIVLATLAAYWQVYGDDYARSDERFAVNPDQVAENPGFIWDDEDYVHENPHLPNPAGLERIWFQRLENPQYYPLVFTTFWLEYRLWGGPDEQENLRAQGYHLTNVLLHALSALLVWWALRRVRFRGALAVGAIFALHPFCVESVAWVTERKNVLSAFFYLLALHSLLTWEERSDRRRWLYYLLALPLFQLGLFSKTVIASLPVALVILRWWRRRPLTTGFLLPLLPFLALGFGMGRLTALHERQVVLFGDVGPNWDLSFVERILIAGRALWFYVGKILWPHPLVFNYARWEIDPGQFTQWLAPLGALVIALLLGGLVRRYGVRGPLAAGLFYAVTVFPALGFVDVAPMRYSFVADHFAYLASLGVIVAAVGAAVAGLRRLRGEKSPPRGAGRSTIVDSPAGPPLASGARVAGAALLALVVLVCGYLTWKQSYIYRDIEYLWRHTLQHHPESHLARINLGVLLRRRGEDTAARAQFERVLADYPEMNWPRSKALTNLGNLDQAEGDLEQAVARFRAAIDLLPEAIEPRYNLANALLRAGRLDEALGRYEDLLARQPDHAPGRYNYGLTLERLGRWPEAHDQYLRVTREAPGYALGWTGVARAEQARGEPERAAEYYREALRRQPGSVAVELGLLGALLQSERRSEALGLAARLLERAPANASLRFEVVRRLRAHGAHAAAVAHLEAAREAGTADMRLLLMLIEEWSAAPDAAVRDGAAAVALAEELTAGEGGENPAVLTMAAMAYAEVGRYDAAIAVTRRALTLAEAAHEAGLAELQHERLELYARGEPYRLE